ncbi:hypothetical protein ACFLQV_04965 [Calditrichota bacterium]
MIRSLFTAITLLFVVAVLTPVFSQSLGLGAAYAPIGGEGFSMRVHLDEKVGLQCGAIVYKNDSETYLSGGVEAIYYLPRKLNTRFYFPVGFGITYHERDDGYHTTENGQYRYVERSIITREYAYGLGFGLSRRSYAESDIWIFTDVIMMARGDYIGPHLQFGIHYYIR